LPSPSGHGGGVPGGDAIVKSVEDELTCAS